MAGWWERLMSFDVVSTSSANEQGLLQQKCWTALFLVNISKVYTKIIYLIGKHSII